VTWNFLQNHGRSTQIIPGMRAANRRLTKTSKVIVEESSFPKALGWLLLIESIKELIYSLQNGIEAIRACSVEKMAPCHSPIGLSVAQVLHLHWHGEH
jgi:hypothetical protein